MANHAFQYTPGKTGSEALGEIGEICVLMQMVPDNVVHMFRDYNTLVAGIAEALKEAGEWDNTYFFFTSVRC